MSFIIDPATQARKHEPPTLSLLSCTQSISKIVHGQQAGVVISWARQHLRHQEPRGQQDRPFSSWSSTSHTFLAFALSILPLPPLPRLRPLPYPTCGHLPDDPARASPAPSHSHLLTSWHSRTQICVTPLLNSSPIPLDPSSQTSGVYRALEKKLK